MLDNQALQKVYYFTTPPLNVLKSNRQSVLLEANKAVNGDRFEVIKGKFYEKNTHCAACNTTIKQIEEKRTDVNISVQMMGDCAKNETDVIVLVSADSDLVPPLDFLKSNHPDKKIRVFFPPRSFSYDLSSFMRGKIVRLENNKVRFINSILPGDFTINGISYSIPEKWKNIIV
jgi:uncharacterized LabA/DUF88 family protein